MKCRSRLGQPKHQCLYFPDKKREENQKSRIRNALRVYVLSSDTVSLCTSDQSTVKILLGLDPTSRN